MLKIVISTLPAFVCAFWSILLFLECRSHNKAKVFLGFFMFVAFLLYSAHAVYFNNKYHFYGFLENIYIFCSLAVYPLYFIYIKSISKKMTLEIKDFWVLIPSFLMTLFSFLLYANMNDKETNFFIQNILYNDYSFYYAALTPLLKLEILKIYSFKIIFFVQLVPIVYFGRKSILDYNKKIQNYYSDTEGRTLLHFNKLLYIFIATSLASTIANIIGKSFFIHSVWLLLIPALLFGLLLFVIGYLGYKQEFTFETYIYDVNKDDDVKRMPPNAIETNNENNQSRLIDELYKLLNEKEIYTKNDLRITDISKILNSNRTYISRIVNEELKTNFCDLINQYRIEHAKKLLKENDCKFMGLSQIGEISGFKSDSSFYRIFKEKEGISPGDYRKNAVRKR